MIIIDGSRLCAIMATHSRHISCWQGQSFISTISSSPQMWQASVPFGSLARSADFALPPQAFATPHTDIAASDQTGRPAFAVQDSVCPCKTIDNLGRRGGRAPPTQAAAAEQYNSIFREVYNPSIHQSSCILELTKLDKEVVSLITRCSRPGLLTRSSVTKRGTSASCDSSSDVAQQAGRNTGSGGSVA